MGQESHAAPESFAGTRDLSEPNLTNQSNVIPPNVDSMVNIHFFGLQKPVKLEFNIESFWCAQTSSFVTKEQLREMFQSELQLGSEYTQSLYLLWGNIILSLMDHISGNSVGSIELSWNIFPTTNDNEELFPFLSPDPYEYNSPHIPESPLLNNNNNGEGINKCEHQSDQRQWESLIFLSKTSPEGPFMNMEKEVLLGKWSEGENLLFESLLTKFGYGQWKKIASFFPNRTHSQCKSHGSALRHPKNKKPVLKHPKRPDMQRANTIAGSFSIQSNLTFGEC
jgi:hypothetical protein